MKDKKINDQDIFNQSNVVSIVMTNNPFDKEEVEESVGKKRCTVKEIKKWMKTLEENRYKKVYNSDARRVSWMVNHVGESVENMPKSMRKKWSKAAYGRERYLAKEFLKSKLSNLKEQLAEQKLRESIRNIVSGLINEQTITEKVMKIKYYKTISKEEWNKTHKNYKSVIDGVKYLMVLDPKRGTILAPVIVK